MTAPDSGVRDFQGTTIPVPGTFALDSAHTAVEFVVRHLAISKVRGRFTAATGSIEVAADPLASRATVEIDAASIDTYLADRDNHLRAADFLDVERYPKLTFVSTGIAGVKENGFELAGELTIRDVTRTVILDVEFEGVATSPWNQEVIAFSATTEINREEFGITWNQALEAGGFLISKTVKIEISAEAIRQP
jgi:polyisoprenoid-binding protein YceI